MIEKEISSKVKSSLIWKFAERICAQGVSFIISIILARILMPEDYGTVSMVLIFITLANVFITSGLNTALIQKKEASETDFSTMFYCNFILSVILYIILYISAPYIADFYNNIELITILRVLALKLPISSINSIQHAYVSRNLIFKKFFFSTLIGTIISGVIGIEMAYKGFGVWALVAQTLTAPIVNTFILLFIIPWKPKLHFSLKSVKELIGFSSKLTLASLISTGYSELRSLIIGKVYTSEDLAYYKKGNSFPDLIINNVDSTIGSVLFPAMSRYNEDKEKVKELTRKSMRTSSYIIFPILVGLFVVAKPLIKMLLTDKWILAVPFMQINCLSQMSMPISTANNQAIKALGRSDVLLKMETLKKTIGIIIILSVMNISVMAIALSGILYAFIATIVNIYPNKKLMNYGFKEQIADILPFFMMSLVMGLVTYSILFLNLSGISTIVLQVLIGIVIYFGLSYLFKIEEFNLLKNSILNFRRRNDKGDCQENN